MVKKQYEKPEIKDFISPSLQGEISPMGICSTGTSAYGDCGVGQDVQGQVTRCENGNAPLGGLCQAGSEVTKCYTGTYA